MSAQPMATRGLIALRMSNPCDWESESIRRHRHPRAAGTPPRPESHYKFGAGTATRRTRGPVDRAELLAGIELVGHTLGAQRGRRDAASLTGRGPRLAHRRPRWSPDDHSRDAR